jgi:hypothetical protein
MLVVSLGIKYTPHEWVVFVGFPLEQDGAGALDRHLRPVAKLDTATDGRVNVDEGPSIARHMVCSPAVKVPQQLIHRRLLIELNKDLLFDDVKQTARCLDFEVSRQRRCVNDGCTRHQQCGFNFFFGLGYVRLSFGLAPAISGPVAKLITPLALIFLGWTQPTPRLKFVAITRR